MPKTWKTFWSFLARKVGFKFTGLRLWSSWSLNTNQPTVGSRNQVSQDHTYPISLLLPAPLFQFSPTFFLNNFAGCIHQQWVETIGPKETKQNNRAYSVIAQTMTRAWLIEWIYFSVRYGLGLWLFIIFTNVVTVRYFVLLFKSLQRPHWLQ